MPRKSEDLTESIFSGGGEMGVLMRAFDWSHTPIGPLAKWPQSLRTAVRIILTSRYAMFIWWGRELVNLYNDPYREFLGIKHPAALGKSAREVWAEIWDQIGPRTDAVLLRGESTFDEALLLLMERHGYLEETYFTFAYSPLPDDAGGIGGIFCAVTEDTKQVIGERRLRLLREIAAATAGCRTAVQVCEAAARCLSSARRDLPFSLLYLAEGDGEGLKRVAEAGIDVSHPAVPTTVTLHEQTEPVWPFRAVMASGEAALVENLAQHFPDLPKGDWKQPPRRAILLPIAGQGQQRPAGVFVAALNPHRDFDDSFKGFLSLLSSQIAGALSSAAAYETQRKRAEELAELDRAKTQFFSNVSHEFRTPLTLLLGPLEEVLPDARERLSRERYEQLVAARRNAVRLLKLVNTLLDFSRIEAGRIQAVYRPTDLARFTSEVASVFRSAMEKAGLHFSVDCEPMATPLYIDCDMWEKIVLNLLSNAFKFTFEGEVALSLKAVSDKVELKVRDTGVGIPQHELGNVFDRFHRIESSRARTYEGAGIGLALVQELVRLHGGTVSVESAPGHGTTFTVSLPSGRAHLPAEQIQTQNKLISTALAAEAYVDEAQRWLPQDSGAADEVALQSLPSFAAGEAASDQKALIVVADDNADMRDYIAHLLRGEYQLHVVSDGLQALEAARKLHPQLVLADVMMPRLDGFGLLRSIRDDPALSRMPVILLSARAGEESRIEGFHAGADDYLVKPFTSRELVARVATHINMAKMRREASEREASLRTEADAERQRLALAQQAAGIGTFELDVATNVNRWSVELEAMHGLAPGGFGGTRQAWEALVHPDDRADVMRQVELSLQTGAPVQGEWRVIWPDGSIHWILGRWQAIATDSGKVGRITGINIDITEPRKAQEARQRLGAIVESSDDAIISKDLHGIVTSWNAAAERMFGYKAEEMIGRSITTIIPRELLADEDRILSTITRGERIEHFETERVRKNGTRVQVSLTVSPVRNDTGKIIGAAKIARDITAAKKAEHGMRTAERLASVGRLAATVAHEINNPLEALTNLVYLARRADSPDAASQYLSAAEEELDRIFHISKQTLGFYREVKGSAPVRLSKILSSLLPVFSSRTRNKSIQVCPEVKSDTEITAVPGEIRQVVANLLSNSIDAVPKGGRIRIRISAASDWSGGRRGGVRLTVADNGEGIAQEVRAHLFEPFVTGNKEVGTGLGLWISKTIVEAHGGNIRVKSSRKPGASWTVFSVFLPVAADSTALKVALKEAV